MAESLWKCLKKEVSFAALGAVTSTRRLAFQGLDLLGQGPLGQLQLMASRDCCSFLVNIVLGLQVYEEYLLWDLMCINRAYFGLFGALG